VDAGAAQAGHDGHLGARVLDRVGHQLRHHGPDGVQQLHPVPGQAGVAGQVAGRARRLGLGGEPQNDPLGQRQPRGDHHPRLPHPGIDRQVAAGAEELHPVGQRPLGRDAERELHGGRRRGGVPLRVEPGGRADRGRIVKLGEVDDERLGMLGQALAQSLGDELPQRVIPAAAYGQKHHRGVDIALEPHRGLVHRQTRCAHGHATTVIANTDPQPGP
jgi:hypothetical protein